MRLNLPQNKKPCTSHLVMGQVKCDIRALDFSFVTFPPRHLIGQQLERGKFARAKPSDATARQGANAADRKWLDFTHI